MADGDQVALLIRGLHALRLVTVGFLSVCCSFTELICGHPTRCLRVSSDIEKQFKFSHSPFSPVASCAMFTWDYILTFGMEVDVVWKSKWNFMKGLYFFQRYLPFIDTTLLILYCQSNSFSVFCLLLLLFLLVKTGEGLTKAACQKIYPAAGGSYN